MSEVSLHVSDLNKYGSPDREKFLVFLYDLEKMGLICSKFENLGGRFGIERVWYPITEKEKT